MADDEDYEIEGEKPIVTKTERPLRRIEVLQHDTTKQMTDEIVEYIQVVLDALQASSANSNAAAGEPAYTHKDLATSLKRKLDTACGGTWHAIVGASFGGNVTNDAQTLLNVKVDGVYLLVMRSGPPERPLTLEDQGESETA